MATRNQSFFLASCVVAALLGGCASKTPEVVARPADCPETVGGYIDGIAMADYMVSCMGKPLHEEKSEDGYLVYVYDFGTAKVTFLFDPSGRLVNKKGYSSAAQ